MPFVDIVCSKAGRQCISWTIPKTTIVCCKRKSAEMSRTIFGTVKSCSWRKMGIIGHFLMKGKYENEVFKVESWDFVDNIN